MSSEALPAFVGANDSVSLRLRYGVAMKATVVAVHKSPTHQISKSTAASIKLIEEFGVEGDVHAGPTVKHRSRAAKHPELKNLRQVHLMHAELFDELAAQGHQVLPGQMGENVTVKGVALLDLPRGTRLRIGPHAEVELTGLRNPCSQLDGLSPGLKEAVLEKTPEGGLLRKTGVMAVVIHGGVVKTDDLVQVALPDGTPRPLEPV